MLVSTSQRRDLEDEQPGKLRERRGLESSDEGGGELPGLCMRARNARSPWLAPRPVTCIDYRRLCRPGALACCCTVALQKIEGTPSGTARTESRSEAPEAIVPGAALRLCLWLETPSFRRNDTGGRNLSSRKDDRRPHEKDQALSIFLRKFSDCGFT